MCAGRGQILLYEAKRREVPGRDMGRRVVPEEQEDEEKELEDEEKEQEEDEVVMVMVIARMMGMVV